jgi:hypothetical protein
MHDIIPTIHEYNKHVAISAYHLAGVGDALCSSPATAGPPGAAVDDNEPFPVNAFAIQSRPVFTNR